MRVTVLTEMELPADTVFDYLADLSNNRYWQSGVDSSRWTSPPPLAVGSTCEQSLESGAVVEYVVTDLAPADRSLTITTQRGAVVPTTVTRTVEVLGESRCRIRMELIGHPRGWRLLTYPLLRWLVRQTIASDYRRLKRVLEAGDEPEA